MKEPVIDKKVAVFLADGCEEIEALSVTDLLCRAGIPHTTVSINETEDVTSSHGIHIKADTTIHNLKFEEYDMLVLPGGLPGTTNLASCKVLTDQVLAFAAEGKQLAAICAAPSVFANLGLLKGVKACCNPGFESVLIEKGADLTQDPVTVCGNFITSRAMGTAIPFGLAIVEHYLGSDVAQELGHNILYR